jgi:hypothetical protein
MQYARQRDKNERHIIIALRNAGAAVQQLDGAGLPDLLVSHEGVLHLVEVKNPNARGGGKYNTGDGVHDTAEALAAIGIPMHELATSQHITSAATSGQE